MVSKNSIEKIDENDKEFIKEKTNLRKEIMISLNQNQKSKPKKKVTKEDLEFLWKVIDNLNQSEKVQDGKLYLNMLNFSKVSTIIQSSKNEKRGETEIEINDYFRNRYRLKNLERMGEEKISLEMLNAKSKENKIKENKKGKSTYTFQEYFLDRYDCLINSKNHLKACFVLDFHNELSSLKFWKKLINDNKYKNFNTLNQAQNEKPEKMNQETITKKNKWYNPNCPDKIYTKLRNCIRLPKEALFPISDLCLDQLYYITVLPIISSLIYNFFIYYYEFKILREQFNAFKRIEDLNITLFKNSITAKSANYYNNY